MRNIFNSLHKTFYRHNWRKFKSNISETALEKSVSIWKNFILTQIWGCSIFYVGHTPRSINTYVHFEVFSTPGSNFEFGYSQWVRSILVIYRRLFFHYLSQPCNKFIRFLLLHKLRNKTRIILKIIFRDLFKEGKLQPHIFFQCYLTFFLSHEVYIWMCIIFSSSINPTPSWARVCLLGEAEFNTEYTCNW